MRILVCCPAATVEGGAEQILAAMQSRLVDAGHEVTFALPTGRFHDPQAFERAFPGMAIRAVRAPAGTSSSRQRGFQRLISDQRPDLVIVSRLFDALVAAARAKAQGQLLRLVYTVFGNEPEYFFDLRAFGGWLDGVVADSQLAAAAAGATTAMAPERVTAIPGPVKPPLGAAQAAPPGAPLRLGYAGRLDNVQKRILDLPEVLARITPAVPFSCDLAGAGPAGPDLTRRLTELELTERVVSHGWLGGEALYESFYPRLDVLLHFAAWEGNPIAPREAMAHGVVPVSARFLGLAREGALRDRETALVFDVGDTAGAAACIRRLHEDRELLRLLSQRARATSQLWAPEAIGRRWGAFLQAIVRLPACQAPGTVPAAPPSGRLGRLGVPEPLADTLRRLLGRVPDHQEAGSEWPHWSGAAAPEELAECRALLERLDQAQ